MADHVGDADAAVGAAPRLVFTTHSIPLSSAAASGPEGEAYVAVESPRGELGCYMVSDGGAHPYRMHIRGPSFVNLQTLPHLMKDSLIADTVAIVSSVDPIMGEVDR